MATITIACGDRNYKDYKKVLETIVKEDEKYQIHYLIEGGAPGADTLSKKAARQIGIQTVECEALWHCYGRAAGPHRNYKQLRLALALANQQPSKRHKIVVLAFHSDLKKSKGTADMVRRAEKAGVHVEIVK